MARWIRRILFALCVVATLLVIAGLAVRLSLQQTTIASLSPKDRAALEETQTKRLNIVAAESPTTGTTTGRSRDYVAVVASELKVAPFKAGTVAAAKTFRDEWEAHRKEAGELAGLWEGRKKVPLPEDLAEVKKIQDRLSELSSLIAAFRNLVAQDDYEIQAMTAGRDPSKDRGIPVPDFREIQIPVRLLALQCCLLAREAKPAEAFEEAQTIISASRTTKYSPLIDQLFGISTLAVGATVLQDCAQRCDEALALRTALEKQNQLAPRLSFIARDPVFDLDRIGIIREGERCGISSDIQGMTSWQLAAEACRVEEEYLRRFALPLVVEGKDRKEILGMIEAHRQNAVLLGARPKKIKEIPFAVSGFIFRPRLLQIWMPNSNEAMTREDVARAKFDLARLAMAEKLFSLEHDREARAMSELLPGYLPEAPKDVFSDDGGSYNETPFFYSVGPDCIDQRGELRYDPSNGTTSAGDIFFSTD